MPHASFDGLRVLSLESRRAREVEKLITTYDGEPTVVPAMRELPLSSNTACLEFGRRLLVGDFDVVLFMTGVGVRTMMTILEAEMPRDTVLEALRRTVVVARSVKPAGVLREFQVPPAAIAPDPATWREVVATLDATLGDKLAHSRLAVQEYGASNPELLAELVTRCAQVTKVPVYQWGLPLDLQPLRDAVRMVIDGRVDVVLFMTAVQVIHLFQLATDMEMAADLRRGLEQCVVVSVGPTTTEELQHYGLTPDFEPSRPKMGFMINEAAQYAGRVLATKRTSVRPTSFSGVPPKNQAAPDVTKPSSVEAQSLQRGVTRIAPSTSTMAGFLDGLATPDTSPESSRRTLTEDRLQVVLGRIVDLVTTVIPCDSCFLFIAEGEELVLRASKSTHGERIGRLKLAMGGGVTGWVAAHGETVAITERAFEDPRFRPLGGLPEDRFEAMLCVPLLSGDRVVGVLTMQHREPHTHSDRERYLLSTTGTLVGAEIERARQEVVDTEPMPQRQPGTAKSSE